MGETLVRARAHNALLLLANTVVLLALLTACSLGNGLPASTEHVPAYPGAYNAIIQNLSKNPAQTWEVVTFQTKDRTDTVLSFYKDNLLNNGWYELYNAPVNSDHGLR